MTTEHLAFTQVNYSRIHAVESAFRLSGKPLAEPGRVLVGKGRLEKRSRRCLQPKYFFLFSDVLVYGSVVVSGHWYKNQKIIRLEDIEIEDLEDSTRMANHWLIRTPRKSFYVAAESPEEKHAWMTHIVNCRDSLLRKTTLQRNPGSTYAPTWIPDNVSAVCMRCFYKFSPTHRRHHCRSCGFLVCGGCSKWRALLRHIHLSDMQRVCKSCHASLLLLKTQEQAGRRGNSLGDDMGFGGGVGGVVVAEVEEEEEEEGGEGEGMMECNDEPSWWLKSSQCSPYIYLNPEHLLAA
ncbi:hypothetical protein CRUP_036312 [Coryphaenoides rupestris]|nr:hypothetical protein CRUP_036312 [Coryphaenoides rupestris]